MNYKVFKKNLESYRELQKEQNRLKDQLDQMYYDWSNVKGLRYDVTPGSTNESQIEQNRLEMIEKIHKVSGRLAMIEKRIKQIDDDIELLPYEVQQMCDLSKRGKSYEHIGRRLGYTKVGIYLKIKSEVEKI